MARRKKPAEAVSGRYIALPHALLDSVAWMGASPRCRALVLELARQLDGKNNGHLHAAAGWMRKRGWSSADAIQKAKAEAMERRLIIRTRFGGLNAGPDLYAVTWLPISNFVNLEIAQKDYHPGAYLFMNPPPGTSQADHLAQSRQASKRRVKRKDHSAHRSSAVPCAGIAEALPVPCTGTKTALFGVPAVPCTGNNESYHSQPVPFRRVVGRAGRSGKPKAGTQ